MGDPIWNEYAAISLSNELLTQSIGQRLTCKFWDYSPLRPDDDVMIGKICIRLNDLYEEQIQQHRLLERKLGTPRGSASIADFQHNAIKQLEDRDYVFVQKTFKMMIDDDLRQFIPNKQNASTFEAMFKFCVLPINVAEQQKVVGNKVNMALHAQQMDQMSNIDYIESIGH